MYTVRFDWLQGKFFVPTVADLNQFLNELVGIANDSWGLTGRSFSCGQLFRQGFKSVCGLAGGYNILESGVEGLIQIQGRLLSAVEQLSIVQLLTNSGLKFTRCDIALDDYNKRVSFNEVRYFGVNGHYRLLDSFKYIESCLVKDMEPAPTCYFGSSGKVIRFYDADFAHGIPANRWELQLRGQYAQSAISEYLADQSCLAAFVVGAIDFGCFTSLSWRSFNRSSWWQSLIQEVCTQPKKLQVEQLQPDLIRSANWIRNQAGIVLAVLKSGLEQDFDDWMKEVCLDGESRFRDYHHQQVSFLKSRNYERKSLYLRG